MADSFFGFDPNLPNEDEGSSLLDEDEYDALNNETFGADGLGDGGDDDWEQQHEQMAAEMGQRGAKRPIREEKNNLEEELEKSLGRLVSLDDIPRPPVPQLTLVHPPQGIPWPAAPPQHLGTNGSAAVSAVNMLNQLRLQQQHHQQLQQQQQQQHQQQQQMQQQQQPRPPSQGGRVRTVEELEQEIMRARQQPMEKTSPVKQMQPPTPHQQQQQQQQQQQGGMGELMFPRPPPPIPPPHLNAPHPGGGRFMKPGPPPPGGYLPHPPHLPPPHHHHPHPHHPGHHPPHHPFMGGPHRMPPPPLLSHPPPRLPLPFPWMHLPPPLQQQQGGGPPRPQHPMQQQQLQHQMQQQQQQQQLRVNGAPSDPYAGLMSAKDRQWLINIQILQLNSQKPYVDDFYHTVYQAKKRAERERAGEQVETPRRDLRTLEPRAYTPATFEGSLGKLQVVSVTAPRKIIDMEVVASEQSGPQRDARRTKQTLLELERLFVLVLRLEDLVHPLPEARAAVPESRVELVTKALAALSPPHDKLQALLAVRKGKVLLSRLLPHLTPSQQLPLWCALLHSLWSLARRDAQDNLLPSLLPAFTALALQASAEQLIALAQAFSQRQDLARSPLCAALANKFGVSAVSALLNRGAELPAECVTSRPEWRSFLSALGEAAAAQGAPPTPSLVPLSGRGAAHLAAAQQPSLAALSQALAPA